MRVDAICQPWESVRFASERSRVRIPSGPPLGAYPNPVLYGERFSFKQEDTPYHYGRECLFTFGEFSDSFLAFPIKSSIECVL